MGKCPRPVENEMNRRSQRQTDRDIQTDKHRETDSPYHKRGDGLPFNEISEIESQKVSLFLMSKSSKLN